MKYAIDVWLHCPPEDKDDALTYDTFNEAMEEKKHLELLQPENYYQIVAVEKEDDDADGED